LIESTATQFATVPDHPTLELYVAGTTIRRDKVRSILIDSIKAYFAQTGTALEVNDDLRLFGRDAPLDSLALVTVLVGFEAAINDQFGTQLVLADERAMSMERSPFRTVSTLVDYACALLDETGKGS
jgi:acyl carrier protein